MHKQFASTYLITGDAVEGFDIFLKKLQISLSNGIQMVQIRAKSLKLDDYKNLAFQAIKLCRRYHAKVLLNTYLELVKELNADGAHLPSHQLMKLDKRPISAEFLFSAACHNKNEIQQATKMRADFILISPVLATPCLPSRKPLGWKKFSELVQSTSVPAYALGGTTPNDIPLVYRNGGIGIAGTRSLW